MGAGLDARSAAVSASLPVQTERAGIGPDHALGTDFHAGRDGTTPDGRVAQLGGGSLRLRIAAPETPQRAALEEDDRPDPWSVVDGVVLDIEDDASLRHRPCSVRQMT